MNDIGIPNYNNLMLDSKYKNRNSCIFIQQKLPGYYFFMYQKSKLDAELIFYNFSYNENFGNFTKFCQILL